MKAYCLILLLSAATASASDQRTWTFNQDGQMETSTGGVWSFKKNGRLDAAFVRAEGTNVVLLTADGQYRSVPAETLSEGDRAYLSKATGISESRAASIEQTAAARQAQSRRRDDAARLRAEATAKRHVAQLELEDAARLENNAGRLGRRADSLEYQVDNRARAADRFETTPDVSPAAGLAYARTKASASVKADTADRIEADYNRLRRDAADKRANAARLQAEADDLENTARSLETGAAPRPPAAR